MDDLVKRADDTADLLDAGSTTGVSTVLRQCASEIEHLQERIETLERQVKAADALADILTAAIHEHDTANYGYGEENPWTMQEWFRDEDRAALAAYRAAKEGGA